MHFQCLSVFDRINDVFSNISVQPGPKIFNTARSKFYVFNVDRAEDKRQRALRQTPARAAAKATKTKREGTKTDHDSDQVSSHDKAIIGESVQKNHIS